MTEVPVIYCLDSPLVNIIQNHNVFNKVKNELWYNTSNWTTHFTQISLVLTSPSINVPFVFQDRSNGT